MHSRNVWLILDATSKVLKLGHGNNPALGQLIDEAFTNIGGVKLRIQVLTKLGQGLQVTSATEHPTVDRSSGVRGGSLLRSLRDKAEQWWYFLDHPEVP